MNRIWLITGCSGGLGQAIALEAAQNGDFVYGTVRNESQMPSVALLHDNIRPLLLDVRDDTLVSEVAEHIISVSRRVDVLVNNAGYGCMGTVEEVPFDQISQQFDTNFYGAVRMIKAILPHMRKAGSGHIINMSSIAGLQGFPGLGYYNASKFALEGMSEALFWEVRKLGIRVTLVEPSPFRTEFAGRSAKVFTTDIEDYASTAGKNIEKIMQSSGAQPGDPAKAARAVYSITAMEKPPLHLVLGQSAYDRARDKVNRLLDEMKGHEKLGLNTDYD